MDCSNKTNTRIGELPAAHHREDWTKSRKDGQAGEAGGQGGIVDSWSEVTLSQRGFCWLRWRVCPNSRQERILSKPRFISILFCMIVRDKHPSWPLMGQRIGMGRYTSGLILGNVNLKIKDQSRGDENLLEAPTQAETHRSQVRKQRHLWEGTGHSYDSRRQRLL